MSLIHRPMRAGAIAVLGLAITAATGALATSAMAASPPAPHYVALTGSRTPIHAASIGSYTSAKMSVEVALAPAHETRLTNLLHGLYTKGSGSYHHWLAKGRFAANFSPAPATRAAVTSFLKAHGLTVVAAHSPFLIRATGSSQQVSAAFRTRLVNYRNSRGQRFFANPTAVHLPSSLAAGVFGVIG